MSTSRTLQLSVTGMDCAECAQSVQQAIAALPGVQSVDVLLASEKAVIQIDPTQVDLPTIRETVAGAGYSIPVSEEIKADPLPNFSRAVLTLFGFVFVIVLLIVIAGEWLGLFGSVSALIPWPLGWLIVFIGGYPVFRNVFHATLKRQVISHTLMTVGVIAALLVGEWTTALVVVLFMRVGDYAEHFTTERSRRAVKDLTALTPQTARVERAGIEHEVPIAEVQLGETIIVRPGEKIPVDGEVIAGQATVDQATITGESMPVEVEPGAKVFAATVAQLGSVRIRATRIGVDTTFGKVIRLVEESELHRADIQRLADRFSAYYLPVVISIAVLTFLIRRDPLSVAAVLVVACSCSFALATPIAILASVGAAAKRGLLIKGGKYLETLDRADILLIDKTGTLTLGRPQVTDVIALHGMLKNELLRLVASAERYSEHPLAEAIRVSAQDHELQLHEPERFEVIPGQGIRAWVEGTAIAVGNTRLLSYPEAAPVIAGLEAQGKTALLIEHSGTLAGIIAAADTVRTEVPAAIREVRAFGIKHIELLTGDNQAVAAALAGSLGITYQASLLPEDKIQIVKAYQAQGHVVVMVGDGVNDAPALAQADVGIAMGNAGADIAIEAARIALLREDWLLIPEVFHIARRTMRIVKINIAFTVIYNLIGLSLAALGILPPVLAAAAQSLPDLGILGNSSRLLRAKRFFTVSTPRVIQSPATSPHV